MTLDIKNLIDGTRRLLKEGKMQFYSGYNYASLVTKGETMMKFEIKQPSESIAVLTLERDELNNEIDLIARDSHGGHRQTLMSFKKGKFKRYHLSIEHSKALGIERDVIEDNKIEEIK